MAFKSVPFHQSIHGVIVLPQKASPAAAVVSDHHKLLFSNYFPLRDRCVIAPTKSRAHSILYAMPIQFTNILVYSSIIIWRSNKNRSIRTVIDSIKIPTKAARTRTYWSV